MRKNLTELVFILDRSGSMSGLEADTIGGYNSLLRNALELRNRERTQQFLFKIILFTFSFNG